MNQMGIHIQTSCEVEILVGLGKLPDAELQRLWTKLVSLVKRTTTILYKAHPTWRVE